ncbi:DnaJ domain-containing protein [Frankia sp. AgKG'84/4]|uniref:DnaJ domain-containing protein n=1 Tax=Frankia sp. AgKG'84/4 TaxID=573490 RepID=UPI00200D9D74|nr:DnaJ domain-containing protein [Frankia sp. AgKG'84/4]MCL9794256.1 DnaJ domain-containing protein [Frankia sp. AgKG'84/4]
MGAEPSLYDVLGVAPDATDEQIRHAYRAAARRTHPDAGGRAPAFAQVNVAYRVLADVRLRRQYDQRLAAGPRPGASGPSSPPGGTSMAPPGGTSMAPPGADPVVRRRYLILMGIALTLFISGGAVVRLYSLPAAMIMMVVAAVIPPIAVTVASRPRQPPGTDGQRPPNGPAG